MKPRTTLQRNLGRLLRPRHIAFVGGSQAEGSLAICQRSGFAGPLWTVNPRREEMGGVPCVPHVNELPEPPDAVLLALSPARTVEAVRDLAAMGAGGAVCMAAGFGEAGEEGEALQAALIEAAGDMAIVGPNCMGILNQFDGAAIFASDSHIASVAEPGGAIISQSGALVLGMTNVEQVFPLGYAISTGNQAVVDMALCIEAVLDDPRVKAIGLYLEGIEDGAALGAACWRAFEQRVPIVVLKGGDTLAGGAVARSHTGAMIVERDLWDAFARRYGLFEVSSPKALVEAVKFLTIAGVPKGNKLTVATFSGGLNGVLAAQAPRYGLHLPQPTPTNAAKLREKMPPLVPIANPLDLNIPWRSKHGMSLKDGQSVAEGLCDLAEDVADMVLFLIDVPRPDALGLDADWQPSLEGMAYVREQLGVPCVVGGILPEGLDVGLRQRLLDKGIAPLLGYSESLEACSVAAKVGAFYTAQEGLSAPASLWSVHGSVGDGRLVDEARAKRHLGEYGLTIPSFMGVKANAEAVEVAADGIGYPVALKILSNEVGHKAKIGGVALNLANADAVEAALKQMHSDVAAAGYSLERVLVEAMIQGSVGEYIIGLKQHPGLGFALLLGDGGSNVEALGRYETVLLPTTDGEVERALDRIGMVEGVSGRLSLKQAISAIIAFAEANQERLVTLDVNPIIVTASGEAIAADALIIERKS